MPLEFPVLSMGEFNMRPTAMLFRNLASMDVEEAIRANPLDGVVLLGGCDKTMPALLMGAASADMPAILVTGGPQLNGNWRGEDVGSCTDCRRYQIELRAGRITESDWSELQGCIIRSRRPLHDDGHGLDDGVLVEALGMAPPGNGAMPAPDSRRQQLAEAAGRQMVDLVERDVRPSRHSHARRIRQRDSRVARHRRFDQRGHPSHRDRRPARHRLAARAVSTNSPVQRRSCST